MSAANTACYELGESHEWCTESLTREQHQTVDGMLKVEENIYKPVEKITVEKRQPRVRRVQQSEERLQQSF